MKVPVRPIPALEYKDLIFDKHMIVYGSGLLLDEKKMCVILYVRDTKSYVQDTKSYVRNTKSYVRDNNSYVRDNKSYVRNTTLYVRDNNSYVRESVT